MPAIILKTLSTTDLSNAPHGASCTLASTGHVNKPRGSAPQGLVYHSPGTTWARGVWDSCVSTGTKYDETAASLFDQRAYQPGYMIGTTGRIFQFALDIVRTQHSGKLANDAPRKDIYDTSAWMKWAAPSDGSGYQLHGREPAVVYDWWLKAFPGHVTPLTVFPWGDLPNNAIGIDLLPNVSGNGPMFTQAQMDSVLWLSPLLAHLHEFPLNTTRVTTHSLASPVERGCIRRDGKIIGTPWDLSPRDFPLQVLLEQMNARTQPTP